MRDMVLSDWRGFLGSGVLQYAGSGTRRVTLDVVTEGCSIVVGNGGSQQLVACGSGAMAVCFVCDGDFSLSIEAFDEDGRTSLRIPHEREVNAGWADGISFVQLDLKSANDVTPEVRRMVDGMQRNALRREQLLRDELAALRRSLSESQDSC